VNDATFLSSSVLFTALAELSALPEEATVADDANDREPEADAVALALLLAAPPQSARTDADSIMTAVLRRILKVDLLI
jgi:hypothetical protein